MEQKDFDRYINDSWRSHHPIPPTYPAWGSMIELRRKVSHRLRSLFLQQPSSSPLSKLYHSGMAYHDPLPFLHSHFLEPLKNASSWEDLVLLSERFQQDNLHVLVDWYLSENPQDPTHYIHTIELPVLTFADRDYYLTKKNAPFRKHFFRWMKAMFRGQPYSAQSAYRIEIFLAKLSVQSTLPQRYKLLSRKELEEQRFPWKIYWKNHPNIKTFLVESPAFYPRLQKEHTQYSLEEWKSYFLWRVLSRYGFSFSPRHYQARERFLRQYLFGQPQPTPFWTTLTHLVGDVLPRETSYLYHRKYGSKKTQTTIHTMANNIRSAFQHRIQRITWLSSTTKKRALKKLHNMLFLIGSSDQKPKPLPSSLIQAQRSLLENLCALSHYKYQKHSQKKKVNRHDWGTSGSHQVNAFYDPNQNRMIIPDGILQPPFYSPHHSLACLYGSIGKIIGHEIVHAFDNYGRKFDEKCRFRTWWKQKEINYYDRETRKIKKIYNQYPDLPINEEMTQGENIADWGALPISLDAYQQADPKASLSSLKEFFVCYAKSRRFHYRQRYLAYLLQEDTHAPQFLRVNLVLAGHPDFHKVFDIPTNSPMYIHPRDIPKIW